MVQEVLKSSSNRKNMQVEYIEGFSIRAAIKAPEFEFGWILKVIISPLSLQCTYSIDMLKKQLYDKSVSTVEYYYKITELTKQYDNCMQNNHPRNTNLFHLPLELSSKTKITRTIFGQGQSTSKPNHQT